MAGRDRRRGVRDRQDGGYSPPILAEPTGGPVPEPTDATRAHDAQFLHHYWTRDPRGLAKWVEHEHPWTALHEHLLPKVGPVAADKYASAWFKEIFGFSAGSDLNRVTHGRPPRGNRVGPG